jgi:hypothetical protein
MLYDHETDPEENVNISEQEDQQKVVQQLTEKLRAKKGQNSADEMP